MFLVIWVGIYAIHPLDRLKDRARSILLRLHYEEPRSLESLASAGPVFVAG
jgi:hypothetical protein